MIMIHGHNHKLKSIIKSSITINSSYKKENSILNSICHYNTVDLCSAVLALVRSGGRSSLNA